ncbi:MAG: hypothetical protein AB7F86_00910 [Bdellovibrionales bacterium]
MKKTVLGAVTALLLVGCGADKAIKNANKIPGQLDKTIERLDKMDTRLDQVECEVKKGISFEALLNGTYAQDLVPVPFDLLPFARQFARCASPEEVAEIVDLWVKKLNEVTLDLPNPTPEDVQVFDKRKMHVYSALQAVAGFTPQAKLDQIIYDQILRSGQYYEATMQLLMLRVKFFRDMMLDGRLFSKPITTVGQLKKAIEYMDEIEFVARLPFRAEIAIAITGFKDPMLDKDTSEVLDYTFVKLKWRELKEKAARTLKLEQKDWSGSKEEAEQRFRELQTELAESMKLIQSRVDGWANPAPTRLKR